LTVDNKGVLLCIDDEPIVLYFTKLLLEAARYDVLTADNGLDGVRVFDVSHVDAVILDYRMPEMDGGAVARRMRELKPQVPIIMYSGFQVSPDDLDGLVDVYVVKGQDPRVLLMMVEQLLTRKSEARRAVVNL